MDLLQMRAALKAMVVEAVSDGQVKLSSGALSDFYIDGRKVTLDPRGAFYIANIMAGMLATTDYDAVGGPTMGADPIVGALCYHLGTLDGQQATGFIIRKEVKGHGLERMIEGPVLAAGARAVIVEDVVTSGGAILKGIKAVEEAGAQVVKTLALVDREAGGSEVLKSRGYEFEAIFSRSELERKD